MLKNVNPGTYDIRYKDLKAGRYYRTENFEIEEQVLASEHRYSKLTMTLFKVPNGNMEIHEISPIEF